MNIDKFKEKVRNSVLISLDDTMFEITGTERIGWIDQDLKNLFDAIDRHVLQLARRHEISSM